MSMRAKACPKCGAVAFPKIGGVYKCVGPEAHTFGNKHHAKRENGQEALSAFKGLVERFGPVDSRLEGEYFQEQLGWMEKAGEISEVRHHTRVELLPNFFFKTDWDYLRNGIRRYADTKGGMLGERFRSIIAIWPIFGHGPLDIVTRKGTRWSTRTVMVGKWDARQTPTGWDFRKVA